MRRYNQPPDTTGMLASVRSLPEARTVLAAGVDVVDLKDPASGVLGALPTPRIREIVQALAGRAATSATVGDLPDAPAAIRRASAAVARTGVDYVKVGVFAGPRQVACIAALESVCALGARIIVVLFADQRPDLSLLPLIADQGCAGVMLDTAVKGKGGLRACLDQARLGEFVARARSCGLLAGLAGSLDAGDVAALLPLRPDYLGFRGALCTGAARTGAIDPGAVRTIRALIRNPESQQSAAPAATEQGHGRSSA